MDNQQGNGNLDLAWLCGFIDGEGSFMMRHQVGKQMRKLGKDYYYPSIRICNTDEPTLEYVASILKSHGLPFHVSRRYPNNGNLPSWDIEVKGLKRCRKWLLTIMPYLKTKKDQAKRMLDFIESRLSVSNDFKGRGYTQEELEIIEHLRRGGLPSQTTRRAGVTIS